MSKIDKRGRWWKKLTLKERSAVGQKAVRSRKRNEKLGQELIALAAKMGIKRAKAVLDGVSL